VTAGESPASDAALVAGVRPQREAPLHVLLSAGDLAGAADFFEWFEGRLRQLREVPLPYLGATTPVSTGAWVAAVTLRSDAAPDARE
jgi:hypothetical protein